MSTVPRTRGGGPAPRFTGGWRNMDFSGFQAGIVLRVAGLLATLALVAWMASQTVWYVTMTICLGAAVTQVVLLARYASRAGRVVARVLDAIAVDVFSASFVAVSRERCFGQLCAAMGLVLVQVRDG